MDGEIHTDISDAKKEILLSLYEKRLELFNVRREHEWQVLIAVVTLIIAADAALLTGKMRLDWYEWVAWGVSLAMLALACLVFEFKIQKRNRVDRLILHEIQGILCTAAGIRDDSCIRLPPDYDEAHTHDLEDFKNSKWWTNNYRRHFLWAFVWQCVVVSFIVLLSIWLVPHISGRLHDEPPKDITQPTTAAGIR